MWFLNSQRNILGLTLLPGGCWRQTAFVQYVLLSFCFCFKYFCFALVTLTLSEVYGNNILKFIKIYEHLFIYYYLIQTITLVGEVSYSSKRNRALHLNLNFTEWGFIYWEFFPQPKEKKKYWWDWNKFGYWLWLHMNYRHQNKTRKDKSD